jgi:hypothetical protein
VPPRSKLTLLARGKPRTPGGARPRRDQREEVPVVGPSAGLHVKGESGQRVLPPAHAHAHIELVYATTAYGAPGSTVTTSHSRGAHRRRLGMRRHASA